MGGLVCLFYCVAYWFLVVICSTDTKFVFFSFTLRYANFVASTAVVVFFFAFGSGFRLVMFAFYYHSRLCYL